MKPAPRLTDFRLGLVTIGNEGRKVSLVLWCAQHPAQLDERQAAVYLAPGKSDPMTVVRKSDATDATVIALDKVHGDAPSRQCCPKRLPVVAVAEDCGNGVIQLVLHRIPTFEVAAPDIPLALAEGQSVLPCQSLGDCCRCTEIAVALDGISVIIDTVVNDMDVTMRLVMVPEYHELGVYNPTSAEIPLCHFCHELVGEPGGVIRVDTQ